MCHHIVELACALLSRISRPLRNLASGLARLKAMILSTTTVNWKTKHTDRRTCYVIAAKIKLLQLI